MIYEIIGVTIGCLCYMVAVALGIYFYRKEMKSIHPYKEDALIVLVAHLAVGLLVAVLVGLLWPLALAAVSVTGITMRLVGFSVKELFEDEKVNQ